MSVLKPSLAMNPGLNLLNIVHAGKTLLWVDDNMSAENQFYATMAEEQGISVLRSNSTLDALSKFEGLGERKHYPQSHLRIISNMQRKENGTINANAGLEFAQALRKRQYLGPILIFCSNTERSKQMMAKEHLVTITNDPGEAIEYACFQKVMFECNRTLNNLTISCAEALDHTLPGLREIKARRRRIQTCT